jgi:adenylate kinase family enzyme
MKTMIIGYSGSGKSTLAAHIASLENAPVLYLDRVHWLPGWNVRPAEEKERTVSEFLDTHTAWVIDGNYSKLSFDRRLEEADRIVFLSFGRLACLIRAYRRLHTYKGRTRESMTEGCNEKVDFEFVRWILHNGRTKEVRDRFAHVCNTYADKVTVIRNQRQLDRFYKTLA